MATSDIPAPVKPLVQLLKFFGRVFAGAFAVGAAGAAVHAAATAGNTVVHGPPPSKPFVPQNAGVGMSRGIGRGLI